MCDCLDKIKKQLEVKFGPVDLELKQYLDGETFEIGTAIPPLYFTYHKKKPSGQPEKKQSRSYLVFNYCPFCGKKEGEPVETKPAEATP